MSVSLGTELWDKSDSIILFNENNTFTFDKTVKVIGDICKSDLVSTSTQKRLIERFLSENDSLKSSQFNLHSNAYFLTEQMLNVLNTRESFSNSFINEIEEIIKVKINSIKKDSRLMKADNKILYDDLTKENQKLENSFKKYRMHFSTMDGAYKAFLKADENKFLSRNQVDSYKSIYQTKKAQYDEAKTEYASTLNCFNNYQTKHYSTLLKEWGVRAHNIENERYVTLRSTFTNVSELCKSMASKFTEIADQIESRIETIECDQDCLTLINREKTGDVPPRDVPFKDFDVQEKVEVNVPRLSNTSNSGSDTTSSNGGTRKDSIPDLNKSIRSMSRNSLCSANTEVKATTNGSATVGLKFIGRLFGGGSKKSKKSNEALLTSPTTETILFHDNQSEIEQLPSLPNEEPVQSEYCDVTVNIEEAISDIKEGEEVLQNSSPEERKSSTLSRRSLDQPVTRKLSRKSSMDDNHSSSNISSLIKRSRGSFRNLLEKRRSRSVSGLMISDQEATMVEKPQVADTKPKPMTEIKPTKPKPGMKPKMRVGQAAVSNRDSVKTRTIEVIRAVGEVEIVSTPAEALAIAARSSDLKNDDQETYTDIYVDITPASDQTVSMTTAPMYDYYYIGSCVAIHGFTSTDPSNIYLSFAVGEQFYIIKEDEANESSGWLLVERIDRSQSGYVPASYMDTRIFDDAVPMKSDHVMLVA